MINSMSSEDVLFYSLTQIVLIIICARIGNNVARRLGQPGVIGEIIAGLALGPSAFGYLYPHLSSTLFNSAARIPMNVLSQIGLVLLMFQVGMDAEFQKISEQKQKAAIGWVACCSVFVPFCLGFCFGQYSADTLAVGIDRNIYSFVCGIAVSITAVPILGRILREFGLMQDTVGIVALCAAAINDLVGWLLLAGVTSYAASNLTGGLVVMRVVELVAGGLLCWLVARPIIPRLLQTFPLRSGKISADLMVSVLSIIIVFGLYSSHIGIFTIFGGFAAGFLFQKQSDFSKAWHLQVHSIVLSFFVPLFFAATGLRTNILGLSSWNDIEWLMLVITISTLGKIVPVYIAGVACRLGHWRSLVLGSLMNTRALMELVVLNVGYDLGYLPQRVFTMLVIMAVVSTLMIGPALRILLPKIFHILPEMIEA